MSKEKKKSQLGIDHGTAMSRLKKAVLFEYSKRLGLDNCYHCNNKILTEKDFTVEHKIPWLDSENPKELFFSLDNVAFSHSKCNYSKARRPNQKYKTSEERLIANREINNRSYANKKNRAVA